MRHKIFEYSFTASLPGVCFNRNTEDRKTLPKVEIISGLNQVPGLELEHAQTLEKKKNIMRLWTKRLEAAVFLNLQFHENNDREVNAKQKKKQDHHSSCIHLLWRLHKKPHIDSGCIPVPFILPPCSPLLPSFMDHHWFEKESIKKRETREDPGWLRWNLTWGWWADELSAPPSSWLE